MKTLLFKRAETSLFFAWFICALAALFYTYEYLLRIEPGIMAEQLRHYFALSAGGLGLLASMYYWAYTPLQLVVGLITDRFGARHVLITAIIACILGTWLFGSTHIYFIAAIARFFIGAGSAFAFVGALKLASDWLPKKYFSFFVGLCTSLGMLGAMFGETVMSWVVDHLGWHPVIADSMWLGVILLGIFFLFVFEKHAVVKKIQRTKPLSFRALGHSLLQIISCKTLWQAGFIGCALFLSLSLLAEQWGNTFIQKALGSNAQSASYYIDMIFFGWFVGSPLHGYLSEKLASRQRILCWGSFLAALTFMPIILWPQLLPHWLLAALFFLFGFFCSTEINCFAIARDWVEGRLTATAVGFMNACVMVGGMIVQPFFGFCLDFLSDKHPTIHASVEYTLSDYQKALVIVPFFLVISFFISYFMKDSYAIGINARKQNKIHLR